MSRNEEVYNRANGLVTIKNLNNMKRAMLSVYVEMEQEGMDLDDFQTYMMVLINKVKAEAKSYGHVENFFEECE